MGVVVDMDVGKDGRGEDGYRDVNIMGNSNMMVSS